MDLFDVRYIFSLKQSQNEDLLGFEELFYLLNSQCVQLSDEL